MRTAIVLLLNKSMLICSMLLLFKASVSFCQSTEIRRNHPINLADQSQTQLQNGDTLTILAVRVAFQEDENPLTSGNGTFAENSLPYLQNNNITIDPLPHDQNYFEAHLTFVQNYFEQISDGQLNIKFHVLSQIYKLDETMDAYSPTGEQFTNTKLAHLARDTWQKVEQEGGFDTDELDPEHTAFIIFHAGVGRDIELVSTNLDKTPQDIPSLFLSQSSLSNLLEDPSFNGFLINNGSFTVTNSIILPRTLSRRGEDVTGQEFVLQLSLNGLLSASIGSYLGLPDLFNTETGASGIGRFGLMDGESFFSYRGLFPPEPSAWEKTYLGWETPFIIPLDDSQITLPAVSLQQPNSIGKHSISSREYFLAENRHRDPRQNDLTITIQQPDGSTVQRTFTNQDEDFVNQLSGFESMLEKGVVTDVSNFDWSLPGGLGAGADGETGTSDDRILNGGILIWHIDEAVIQQQIDEQKVNANPNRRGVDLEEADGSQDIGQAPNENFSEFARGTAFDFWWEGNNASVITSSGDTLSFYENRFANDTRPNNKSNSGAPSFFEFYNFSENLPEATFRARQTTGSDISPVQLPAEGIANSTTAVSPEEGFLTHYPPALSIFTTQSDTFLIVPSEETAHALHLNDASDPLFDFQQQHPQHPFIGKEQVIFGNNPISSPFTLNSWSWDGNTWQQDWEASVPANKGFLSSSNGDTLLIDLTNRQLLTEDGSSLPPLPDNRQTSVLIGGSQSIITDGQLDITNANLSFDINTGSPRMYTGAIQLQPDKMGFYLLTDQSFRLIDPEQNPPLFPIVEQTGMDWPALVDFDDNGYVDILYVNKNRNELVARNQSGAVLSYFPITPPDGSRFTGTPLIADIEGDGQLDILITGQDSLSANIYAYDQRGTMKEEFPLFVGSTRTKYFHPVQPVIYNSTMYAVSHIGELKAWHFPDMGNIPWRSAYGNEPFNKVTGRIASNGTPQPSSQLLVDEETYNWPNPASDQTNIRYRLSKAGKVEIKIITPGGRVVYNQSFEAGGGIAEEQTITTSNWGSGIYLAMVTATVNGQKERKMIKIAVVH